MTNKNAIDSIDERKQSKIKRWCHCQQKSSWSRLSWRIKFRRYIANSSSVSNIQSDEVPTASRHRVNVPKRVSSKLINYSPRSEHESLFSINYPLGVFIHSSTCEKQKQARIQFTFLKINSKTLLLMMEVSLCVRESGDRRDYSGKAWMESHVKLLSICFQTLKAGRLSFTK